MKKLKFFATISTMCLALAVLCFGVFSATQVTYIIGGSISYEVNDVFVQIETKVYRAKAKQTMNLQTLKTTAQTDFENKTFSEIDTTKYELYKDDIETFSSLNATIETATGRAENININYNQSYQYYIVVNIKSYTSDLKTFALINKVTEGENSNVYTTPYANDIIKPENVTFDDATNKGKTLVIAYSLKDPKTSVGTTNNSFEYSITVEKGDMTYDKMGFLFNMNEDGKSMTLSSYSGSAGELVIPATVGDSVIVKKRQLWSFDSLNEFLNWDATQEMPTSLTKIALYSVKYGNTETMVSGVDGLLNALGKNVQDQDNEFVQHPVTISYDVNFSKEYFEDEGFITDLFTYLEMYLNNDIIFDIQLGNNEKVNCSNLETLNSIKSSINTNDETQFPIKVINTVWSKKLYKVGNTYPVTKIGERVFYNNDNLVKVEISAGIKEISKDAFRYCNNLTDLKIPSSIEKIEEGAIDFRDIFKNYEFDENGFGFLSSSDDNNVKFWATVKDEFNISNITQEMLSGVSIITDGALNSISRKHYGRVVKSIEIPSSVVCVIGNPLEGCSLDSIRVYDGNQKYTSGSNNKYLLEKDSGRYVKSANIEIAEFPNDGSVKVIGAEAFSNCLNLKSATLPNGIETIEKFAFDNCENLENITLPNGLKSIKVYAFYGCDKLTSLIIPASVNRLSGKFFDCCEKLASIKFEAESGWSLYDTSDIEEKYVKEVTFSATDYAKNVTTLSDFEQTYREYYYLAKYN